MKTKIIITLTLLVALVIFVFVRLETIRKNETALNTPDFQFSKRPKELLAGEYKITPNSIPLAEGRMVILRCWAEHEVSIPFFGISAAYEKTGRLRLVVEVADNASNYGVDERIKMDREYTKQRFVQGAVDHRIAWKLYEKSIPTEFTLERRSGDLNIQLKMHLSKAQQSSR